jgi:hypothetical protein
MKNPPCQKAWRVSEVTSVNSTSSLAVFYVEQVALNRHVMPLSRLHLLCYITNFLSTLKLASQSSHNSLLTFCVKGIGTAILQ